MVTLLNNQIILERAIICSKIIKWFDIIITSLRNFLMLLKKRQFMFPAESITKTNSLRGQVAFLAACLSNYLQGSL